MKTFAITGATGLIGSLLHKDLITKNNHVIVLTRNPAKIKRHLPASSITDKLADNANTKYVEWNAYDNSSWNHIINEVDAFVHLAGAPIIEKRWTEKRKIILYESRINSTKTIVDAIAQADKKPELLIVSSGVNYYGSSLEKIFYEDSPTGQGFMAELAEDWERAAAEVEKCGVRRVSLRTGMVLSSRGGALPKIQLPFKFFVGGVISSGKQILPWIHENDFIDIINFVTFNPSISGAVNAVAPQPVRMKEFCLTLGRVMNRSCWTKAPEFMIKLILGEVSSVLLEGQNVYPKKLLDNGFNFNFSELEKALRDIIKS
ncbi:MAG: TIGR01777 family oxidoreductase [Bacteroidetes bacterium]|nr:TIGR01777 family oxidoreductase [Bacteroidota bacterium]MBU2586405.1 TIGR01777 family oxidoreductase [Bacteroidota bacterium]